jgi:hypothetical protein
MVHSTYTYTVDFTFYHSPIIQDVLADSGDSIVIVIIVA